jgi:hypothetical protein
MSRSTRSLIPGLLPTTRAIAAMALSLAGLLVFGATGAAQDASPTPAPAITTEVLGERLPSDIPGKALWLMRVTLAPGCRGGIPLAPWLHDLHHPVRLD